MKDRVLSIHVAATPAENAAVQSAVAWFNDRLAEGGWTDHAIRITAGDLSADHAERTRPDILIVSLLPEVDAIDEAWTATETRLRDRFESIQRNGTRCCLFTIFRHVAPDQPRSRVARIRRLNLLATELSRQASLFVIDVDRALADAGSRAYATNYRLHGDFAVEAVAHEVAALFLAAGFHAALPRPAQQALETALDAWHPRRAAAQALGPLPARPTRDRRMAVFESKEKQLAHVVQQLLRRRMRYREAWGLLSGAVRRKGLRASVSITGHSALRLLNQVAMARSRSEVTPRS